MTWDTESQNAFRTTVDMVELRRRKLEATQHLLGDTMEISEQAWQEPSRLPGWTRAHIATHLARNADAITRMIDSLLNGRRASMYESEEQKRRAMERGSERSGLELQIDLDTTAGRLNRRFNVLDTGVGAAIITIDGHDPIRADLLPFIRLNEVVLHHVDLDCGFEITDVDPVIASWLLDWHMVAFPTRIGDVEARREGKSTFLHLADGTDVHPSDASILGWLTGRLRAQRCAELGLPDQPTLR